MYVPVFENELVLELVIVVVGTAHELAVDLEAAGDELFPLTTVLEGAHEELDLVNIFVETADKLAAAEGSAVELEVGHEDLDLATVVGTPDEDAAAVEAAVEFEAGGEGELDLETVTADVGAAVELYAAELVPVATGAVDQNKFVAAAAAAGEELDLVPVDVGTAEEVAAAEEAKHFLFHEIDPAIMRFKE